jgi:hypothetical protein
MTGQIAVGASESVSGPDGRFSLRVPDDALALDLLVFPPGHAMKLARVFVQSSEQLQIQVDRQGGTLILEVPPGGPEPLLAHGGSFTLLPLLKQWSRQQGERASDASRVVLPNLEAGVYSLCAGAQAVTALKGNGEPPQSHCHTGTLPAFGQLVLKRP